MSYVADVIVMWDVCAAEGPTIAAINTYFDGSMGEDGHGYPIRGLVWLNRYDEQTRNRDAYGGNKALQAEVAIGAVNCLDVERFIAHLRDVFSRPEIDASWAQVAIQNENMDGFRMVDVRRTPDCDPPGWYEDEPAIDDHGRGE